MKFKSEPFPPVHFLVEIPLDDSGDEYTAIAFDVEQEALSYIRAIPECVYPGARLSLVDNGVKTLIEHAQCYSYCPFFKVCKDRKIRVS
jgi:hypothetical protein